MSTLAQPQPTAPTRRLFPHLSPPRAVTNIISTKRHASSFDLKAKAAERPNANTADTPLQRRTVSFSPTRETDRQGDLGTEKQRQQDTPIGPKTTGVSGSPALHKLTFPHVAKLFVKLRRMQKKAKAHHIISSSGTDHITHPSLLDDNGELDVMMKLARLEIQEDYVCVDGVDVAKLLRASRAALLEHASPLHANTLIDELYVSIHPFNGER